MHLSRSYRGAEPRRLTCTDFPVNDLVATPRLAAITVAEMNPDHDPDGAAVERFVAGLVQALSGALLH